MADSKKLQEDLNNAHELLSKFKHDPAEILVRYGLAKDNAEALKNFPDIAPAPSGEMSASKICGKVCYHSVVVEFAGEI